MGRFAGEPDYTLQWPPEILEAELERLIDIARRDGVDRRWTEEVEVLLSQAFTTTVPTEDFREVSQTGWMNEPF